MTLKTQLLLSLSAALLTAGAAQAQSAAPTADTLRPFQPQATLAARALSGAIAGGVTPLAAQRSQDSGVGVSDIRPTSVARPLGRSGVVGSAGFMCGLGPDLVHRGSSTISGYDPTGRFVGARLSLAFK